MNWISILVSAIIGFILGCFLPGTLNMIAIWVLKKKIQIGEISKSALVPNVPESWYITVDVKESFWWSVLVSRVEDVVPLITFIKHGGDERQQFESAWINPLGSADGPSIGLQIGMKRKVGIVEKYVNALVPYGQTFNNISLIGDFDISLELDSGYKKLCHKTFVKAIVGGLVPP